LDRGAVLTAVLKQYQSTMDTPRRTSAP